MSDGYQCGKSGFTFVWTIQNFGHCVEEKESSLRFYFCALDIAWQIHLYPRGNSNDNIECSLRKDSISPEKTVDCEVCICTFNGERLGVDKKENLEFPDESYCTHTTALFERQIIDHLPQDTLVIHCHLWESGSDRTETPVHCHHLTCINVQKKMFFWNIEEFSSLQLEEEKVFCLKPVEKKRPTLTFKISLAGATVGNAFVPIVIDFEGGAYRTYFTCSISVLDRDGNTMKYMTDAQWLKSNGQVIFSHFLTRRELMADRTSYLPGDVLTLKCKVTLSDGRHHYIEQVVYGQSTPVAVGIFHKRLLPLPRVLDQSVPNTLRGDLELLYEGGAFCDFKLSAGGRAFSVHRLLLGARSPVFRNMFLNDMVEKELDTLHLPDVDPDALDRMLRYVYTDAMPDIGWQDAALLYYAADKYQLPALRQRCSALLGDRLDASNAAEVLALADRHRDPDLKGAVRGFISERGKSALESDGWRLLEEENPRLAFETLRSIFYP